MVPFLILATIAELLRYAPLISLGNVLLRHLLHQLLYLSLLFPLDSLHLLLGLRLDVGYLLLHVLLDLLLEAL